MKRVICVLLSVCMLLCLAACGGDHDPTTGTTKPEPTKGQIPETTEAKRVP